MSNEGKVVVIGGGLAGLTAIRALEKKIGASNIVLIEPKEYAEVPFAMLRALTDPDGIGVRARRPWSQITQAEHIRGHAKTIEGNEVVLENGDRVPFAQAVVTTGSTTTGYPFLKSAAGAATVDQRVADLRTEAEKFKAARSVLILGGGPIGVELAGEITSAWPEKLVTLVERGERLLSALPPSAGKKALRILLAAGVTVHLQTTLEQSDGAHVAPDGTGYTADLVILATGVKPDAIPVDGEGSLDERKQLKVDEHLRVVGRENVFAAGDASDIPDTKQGAIARLQIGTVVKNVVAVRTKPGSKLKIHKSGTRAMLVTLGRKAGIAYLPFGRADFMAKMKQKDMFVSSFLRG